MIHEALFSLWNSRGTLFKTLSKEEWLRDVELREFLHPAERELLGEIMSIALTYHTIEEFRKDVLNNKKIEHVLYEDTEKREDGQDNIKDMEPGLYITAFCNGLDKVLKRYRDEIVDIEEEFLKHPELTLSFVLGRIENFNTLFDVLIKMIRMIQIENVRGALLLGRLHLYLDCNIPMIVEATKVLISFINVPFYHQLSKWIIYGDIKDKYNEFFICDANCPDENFQYPDNCGEEAECYESHTLGPKKSGQIVYPVRKFYIRPEMLPSIISYDLAEKILFMGRTVWINENRPIDANTPENYTVWNRNGSELYQKVLELEKGVFDFENFERTIEKCRLKLTKHLWTIVVDEAKLLEHLQNVRDYYGLGRGELFQRFIVTAGEKLKETPNSYIVTNLNMIFSDTAAKIYGEYDKSFKKFELAIVKQSETCDNPWTLLKLNFDIVWPLHIIFYPKTLDLYNRLFRFLLTITRTQIELNKLWHNHISSKKKINKRVWTLRHNLMFLVNNLQYYLQVDVIEAEFSTFKKAVQNANEFEDIIRLHSKFLCNLLSKTFVMTVDETTSDNHKHNLVQLPALNYKGKNTMYSIIYLILELCNEFCLYAHTWDAELTEMQQQELEGIETRANNLTDMLLRTLSNHHQKVYGSDLLQLMYWLDFNQWYTKTDFNLTVG
nr:gamma-tubulin complex component 4 [Onthophagus taurus]